MCNTSPNVKQAFGKTSSYMKALKTSNCQVIIDQHVWTPLNYVHTYHFKHLCGRKRRKHYFYSVAKFYMILNKTHDLLIYVLNFSLRSKHFFTNLSNARKMFSYIRIQIIGCTAVWLNAMRVDYRHLSIPNIVEPG